jgi:DNA-binding response OmpR family regulator
VDVQLVGSEKDDEGLDLVRSLAKKPGAPLLVLATAFKQHALEAFDLGVIDYLLKPFTEERVAQCLERVRARRASLASGAGPSGVAASARIVARRKRASSFSGSTRSGPSRPRSASRSCTRRAAGSTSICPSRPSRRRSVERSSVSTATGS